MKVRLICLCLLLATVSALFCSCMDRRTDEEKIYDRLEAFLEAYNNGDFDGVLESMSQKTRSAFEGVAGLFGSGTGYSLGDVFGVAVYGVSEGDLLDVAVLDLVIEGEEATVRVEMTYNDTLINTTDKVKFILVKEENDWFVSDLKDHVLSVSSLAKRLNALAEKGTITMRDGEKEREKWLEKLNNVLVRNDKSELSHGISSYCYDKMGQVYLMEFASPSDAKQAAVGLDLLYANGEFDVEDWYVTREGNALLLGEREIVESLITINFDENNE